MAIVLYDTMLYIWCSRCKESKTIHLQGGTTMAEKVKYITVDKQEVYENEIKPLVDQLKDDKRPGFIKVTKGFKTVLPDHIEIEL